MVYQAADPEIQFRTSKSFDNPISLDTSLMF